MWRAERKKRTLFNMSWGGWGRRGGRGEGKAMQPKVLPHAVNTKWWGGGRRLGRQRSPGGGRGKRFMRAEREKVCAKSPSPVCCLNRGKCTLRTEVPVLSAMSTSHATPATPATQGQLLFMHAKRAVHAAGNIKVTVKAAGQVVLGVQRAAAHRWYTVCRSGWGRKENSKNAPRKA